MIIPSRTSSLHSRITQPLPALLTANRTKTTPKTLTHAYMVCGVGREPSQWVRAPTPAYGKIQHMKGAVNQFWLPEILGSSPRLEQDNEIARALHAAMRVSQDNRTVPCVHTGLTSKNRLASPTTSRSAPDAVSLTAFITPLFFSKIPSTLSTALPFEFGLARTRNALIQSGSFAARLSQSTGS